MSGPPGYAFQPMWNDEEIEARQDEENQEEEENDHPEQAAAPDRHRLGNNDWCRCGNCPAMPTALECICCREIIRCCELQRDGCIIDNVDFTSVCLNQAVARVFNVARRDIRGHNRPRVRGRAPEELTNKSYRYTGYRLFTYLIHGYLGMGVRKVIPACVVQRLHEEYPEESGLYIGFKRGDDDEELEVPEQFAI